jgi:hypothetical protein
MGVEPQFIVTADERKDIDKADADAAAAQAALAAATGGGAA